MGFNSTAFKSTAMKASLALILFLAGCSAVQPDTDSSTAPQETVTTSKPVLADYSGQIEEITDLILEGEYIQAHKMADRIRLSVSSESEVSKAFDNLYNLSMLFSNYQNNDYNHAYSFFNSVVEELIPEALEQKYEEISLKLPDEYKAWLEAWKQEQAELLEAYYYNEEEFKEVIDNLTDDLLKEDLKSANKIISDMKDNSSRWNQSDRISQQLIDTYFALAWYTDCLFDYKRGEVIQADGCLIALKDLKLELPSSLKKHYEEYAKAARTEAQAQYSKEAGKKQSSSHTSSGCNDEYNACEYDDALEFYYYNGDWFIDYEDAEEYWEKHH